MAGVTSTGSPAVNVVPVLLIVSAGNGHWFAAGTPKNDAADR